MPHRWFPHAAALMLAALLPLTAQAGFPLAVDDADVNQPGEYEWVMSSEMSREPGERLGTADVALSTGIIPGLEGSVEAGSGWVREHEEDGVRSDHGLLDMTLELKAPVAGGGDGAPYGISLEAAAKLPTSVSESGLDTNNTDLSLLAVGTVSWGRLSLDMNAGANFTGIDQRSGRHGDSWLLGAALRWEEDGSLLFVESTWALPADGRSTADGIISTGAQLKVAPHVQIGASLGAGCTADSPTILGLLGVTLLY